MNHLLNAQRERSCTQQQAFHFFETELNHLGWTFKENKIGEGNATFYTELFDSNGRTLQDGMGKGIGLQSILSSRFESLEHSITDLSSKLIQNIWIGSISEAQYQGFSFIPGSIPNEWIYDINTSLKKSYWKIFTSSKDGRAFLFPLSKLDPFSEYHELHPDDDLYLSRCNQSDPWFRHNSGTAIGTSLNEALVHGLNEAIERYSISSHYADCYLKSNQDTIKLLDLTTIPISTRQLISSIEDQYQTCITIIDITSELGIKTFAVRASGKQALTYIGYGSSLFSEYALERAILECQQMIHTSSHPIYGPQNYSDMVKVQENLREYPILQDAILLKFEGRKTDLVQFESKQNHSLSLVEQKSILDNILKMHNIEVFSSIVYESAVTPITAIRLIVPEFSDFSFIADGFPVVPSGRVLQRLIGKF